MKKKIIQLLQDACALEEKRITLRTGLKDISLDSLSFIEFLVRLEEEYKIQFEPDELDINGWECVADIVNAVAEKKKLKP